MKSIKKVLFLIAILFSVSLSAQKLGHINSNKLLMAMPERSTIETEIKTYAAELEAQLSAMHKEYQSKVSAFQAKSENMTETVRNSRIKEITDLESRIQEFQASAQAELQEKEEKLLQPLIDKAKKAIEDVASENGYTYIFDAGVGVLLYQKDSSDIMPLVKKKLGLI